MSDTTITTPEAGSLPDLDEVASAGRTALYRLYDADDLLLYIGISDDPETRFGQHAGDKDWWPQVRRKTVVWYQSRPAAETAETITVGLEQPVHNKAKRYVRLPEQPFEGARPGRRRPRRAAAGVAPAEKRQDLEGIPSCWPTDMWCRTWWDLFGRGWICMSDDDGFDAGVDFRYTVFHNCPLLTPPEAAKNVEWARSQWLDSGYMAPQVWHQDDSDMSPVVPVSYSAHFDHSFGPNRISHMGSLPDDVAGPVQRKLLESLVTAGRCTEVAWGPRAIASGFRHQEEAAATGVLLELLTFGHLGLMRACTDAIRRQGCSKP